MWGFLLLPVNHRNSKFLKQNYMFFKTETGGVYKLYPIAFTYWGTEFQTFPDMDNVLLNLSTIFLHFWPCPYFFFFRQPCINIFHSSKHCFKSVIFISGSGHLLPRERGDVRDLMSDCSKKILTPLKACKKTLDTTLTARQPATTHEPTAPRQGLLS